MAIEVTQNINSMSAHEQWRMRPSDERYQSIVTLRDVARARQRVSTEKVKPFTALEFAPYRDSVAVLVGKDPKPGMAVSTHKTPVVMNNWSFGQMCAVVGAPAAYLRTLPPDLSAANLNAGMAWPSVTRSEHQLFLELTGGDTWMLRAITSPDYGRIYNADIADGLVTLQERLPALQLPMGYKDGKWGGELVPSGAYLGDRDMFVMLIDGNRGLDDPTDSSNGGLFRGIIVRNSEVGAAYLTFDLFYFRRVCGNNIIWGFKHAIGFRRRHVGTGKDIAREFRLALGKVDRLLNAGTTEDRAIIQRATTRELAAKREDVITLVAKIPGANETIATNAYAMAEKESGLNPRSVWGMAQGLTYVSQQTGFQDERFAIDRAASKLLTKYAA